MDNMFKNPAIQPFKFQFGLVNREVIGGPYYDRPTDYFGVKMAVEIKKPCNVDIPTHDFNVPSYADLDKGVRAALIPIARGNKVYVGCMGGIGRTGLFMGALSNLLKHPDPVKYVRANFKSHAIETKQQQDFVNNYKPSLKTRLTASVAKAIALAY
jgi:protein-tyrosine phosphatase